MREQHPTVGEARASAVDTPVHKPIKWLDHIIKSVQPKPEPPARYMAHTCSTLVKRKSYLMDLDDLLPRVKSAQKAGAVGRAGVGAKAKSVSRRVANSTGGGSDVTHETSDTGSGASARSSISSGIGEWEVSSSSARTDDTAHDKLRRGSKPKSNVEKPIKEPVVNNKTEQKEVRNEKDDCGVRECQPQPEVVVHSDRAPTTAQDVAIRVFDAMVQDIMNMRGGDSESTDVPDDPIHEPCETETVSDNSLKVSGSGGKGSARIAHTRLDSIAELEEIRITEMVKEGRERRREATTALGQEEEIPPIAPSGPLDLTPRNHREAQQVTEIEAVEVDISLSNLTFENAPKPGSDGDLPEDDSHLWKPSLRRLISAGVFEGAARFRSKPKGRKRAATSPSLDVDISLDCLPGTTVAPRNDERDCDWRNGGVAESLLPKAKVVMDQQTQTLPKIRTGAKKVARRLDGGTVCVVTHTEKKGILTEAPRKKKFGFLGCFVCGRFRDGDQ